MFKKFTSIFRKETSSETVEQDHLTTNDPVHPDVEKLEHELKEALESKDAAVSLKEDLEEQISKLETRLTERETEIKELNSRVVELSSIPTESKEAALIESLKKDLQKKSSEISSKEEEIEDLEDEISSTKKKLKSAKAEVDELTLKIESSDKTVKKYERDLKDMKSELTDLKEEDKVKSDAIEFVNAVLEAKDADDRDAKTIDEKVNKIESIIFDQYIPLYKHYLKESKDKWLEEVKVITRHWANLQRKSWIKRKKVVAFIGEFSAGKTSIVNRILSQDDTDCPRLPVSSKATTAIATYISYGEGFHSQFTDANGNLKNLPHKMFTMVNKDILAKVNVSSIIQYFVMKYKNDNLRGLSILDTPGFSSNDDQDQERTLAVINEADALFWVLDANSGEINRTSLNIIADNVHDVPLYVVINKADTKAPAELDRLERHIKETMSRAEIDVRGYVRFSQKAPLKDIMTVVESLPEGRTGLDIFHICYDLKRILAILQRNLDKYNRVLDKLDSDISDHEDSITDDIGDIVEYCYRIANIPQHDSGFFIFRDEHYKMNPTEYQELYDLCVNGQKASKSVEKCFEDYKYLLSNFHDKSKDRSESKEQYSDMKKIYDSLIKAIKDLDSNLSKEIEAKIEAKLKEDDNRNSRGYNNYSSTNTGRSTASTNTNRNNTPATPQQEFEKANQLYNNGAVEEAKFWYRKAAQHGYKAAKDQCRKLGITF